MKLFSTKQKPSLQTCTKLSTKYQKSLKLKDILISGPKIIQDATSSNDKLMAMKNHHPTAKLSFSNSPVTPPPHQNLIISQSRTPTNRPTSNNQQSNSQQSSPGGPNSVDSGNSSGKAHDLSHSSNSSTHSDEVQQNTMVRTTGNPENSRKNTPISENSSKAPEFGVADVITLSLVRQCRDSWYQPNLSRDRAINKLKTAPFGAFIIRDSTSFVGGYGLAIRVKKLPDRIQNSVKPGMPPMDLLAEHVRHYLIESVETAPGKVGYQIKGNLLEPVYPNLDMLVYKHILESISLPISLDLRLHAQHLPKTHKLLQNVKNSEKIVRSTVETEQGSKKTSNASKTSQRLDSSRQSLQSPNLPEKTVKTTSFSQHVPDNSESSSNNQLKNQFQYNQDSTLQNTLLNTRQKISVQNTPPLKDTTPPSFPVSIKQQKSASVSTTKNVHVANEPFDLKSLTLNGVNETLNSINSFGFAPSENNTMRRTASHNPQPSHALGTGIGRMTNTQTIYSCHLVYIGCRDCEKLAGPAAVERSLNTILTNNKQNSSLIGFKIQKSGFTLTDEARKLFFRKHFNRKQLLTCDMDPKTRQLDVSAYSGLAKPAHLFGVVVQASGSQNQCHILAEVDQSVSTAVIVAKIRDFINEQK